MRGLAAGSELGPFLRRERKKCLDFDLTHSGRKRRRPEILPLPAGDCVHQRPPGDSRHNYSDTCSPCLAGPAQHPLEQNTLIPCALVHFTPRKAMILITSENATPSTKNTGTLCWNLTFILNSELVCKIVSVSENIRLHRASRVTHRNSTPRSMSGMSCARRSFPTESLSPWTRSCVNSKPASRG